MTEQWCEIKDTDGRYSISNQGRVYSRINEKLLMPRVNPQGYHRVHFYIGGQLKDRSVHRVVAEAFIPNPDAKLTVNHISEDKSDNSVSNLEWATTAEQNSHGARTQRATANTDYTGRKTDYALIASKHNYRTMNQTQMRPVVKLDIKGNILESYGGVQEAARETGVNAGKISECAHGRRKTTGGYRWEYETQNNTMQLV